MHRVPLQPPFVPFDRRGASGVVAAASRVEPPPPPPMTKMEITQTHSNDPSALTSMSASLFASRPLRSLCRDELRQVEHALQGEVTQVDEGLGERKKILEKEKRYATYTNNT